MYQPGMDHGLAKIQYAEMLAEAARERAAHSVRTNSIKPATRRLAVAFAALAPVAALVWLWLAH